MHHRDLGSRHTLAWAAPNILQATTIHLAPQPVQQHLMLCLDLVDFRVQGLNIRCCACPQSLRHPSGSTAFFARGCLGQLAWVQHQCLLAWDSLLPEGCLWAETMHQVSKHVLGLVQNYGHEVKAELAASRLSTVFLAPRDPQGCKPRIHLPPCGQASTQTMFTPKCCCCAGSAALPEGPPGCEQ